MQIAFSNHFEGIIDNLNNKAVLKGLDRVIGQVVKATRTADIPNIKKMKGHKTTYRIRIGDYRVGLFIEGGVATFVELDHRKDIYNRWP